MPTRRLRYLDLKVPAARDEVRALRTHSTQWLEVRQREVIDAQRKLHAEELAIVRVLDERGRIDVEVGAHGESSRVVREKVETARALEALPAVATAVFEGRFSVEQLRSVVRLADEASDAEWAARAPQIDPGELARLARTKAKPSAEEGFRRNQQRSLHMWWEKERGMIQLRGELPDVLGAKFEAAVNRITDRMKPAKGQPWESGERRQADALLEMCAGWESTEPVPTASRPLLQTEIPMSGPAEIVGIPLSDAMVEQLRASASIEPVLVDADATPTAVGRRSPALSPKVVRAVLLHDGHCRCRPGCELRYGLQVHHIRPRSYGGTDEMSNLVAVASSHHAMLIPQGPYALLGNPNLPDGLRMVHVDALTAGETQQVGLPPRRAGPNAA